MGSLASMIDPKIENAQFSTELIYQVLQGIKNFFQKVDYEVKIY